MRRWWFGGWRESNFHRPLTAAVSTCPLVIRQGRSNQLIVLAQTRCDAAGCPEAGARFERVTGHQQGLAARTCGGQRNEKVARAKLLVVVHAGHGGERYDGDIVRARLGE